MTNFLSMAFILWGIFTVAIFVPAGLRRYFSPSKVFWLTTGTQINVLFGWDVATGCWLRREKFICSIWLQTNKAEDKKTKQEYWCGLSLETWDGKLVYPQSSGTTGILFGVGPGLINSCKVCMHVSVGS